METLPIHSVLDQTLATVADRPAVVLRAPPGAGKTTVVPWEVSSALSGRVFLTQPRRLAARSVAARIAMIKGVTLGEEVGYQVRLERRWGRTTRLVAMTTGVLLRRMLHDPFLEGTAAVVLDEFHERTLEMDVVLGMLKRLQDSVRPDLKIVVMSATIDCGLIAEFLDQAPVIESPGRMFDVQVRYSKNLMKRPIEEEVAEALPRALDAVDGHVLVFLPGVGEIMRTQRAVQTIASRLGAAVMPLFGDMDAREQDRVLAPSERRKIILATNVAETSLTIDGVRCVIDSGLVRVMRFDASVGMSRLCLESNSQASADQRAGRAGRQGPGVVFRLWPESVQRSRPAFDTPEILRGDLAGALLQLAGMGESDFADFPWLTKPSEESIARAQSLLVALGAIEEETEKSSRLTPIGQRMLRLPAGPRAARLLVAADEYGVTQAGALAAAMLSERDPFRISRGQVKRGVGKPNDRSVVRSQSDVVDRVHRLEHVLAGNEDPLVNRSAVFQVVQAANEYLTILSTRDDDDDPAVIDSRDKCAAGADANALLQRAIFAAYPDRLARRRASGSDRGVMVGGSGVRLGKDSNVVDAELFVCVDVEQRDRDAEVRMASAVDFEWLPPDKLLERDDYFFHPTQRTVQARRRTTWMDLVISETPVAATDADQVGSILFANVLSNWEQVFPADDPRIGGWLTRLTLARQWQPEAGWPEITIEDLHEIARQLCDGRRSLAEVRDAPWLDYLWSRLPHELSRALDRVAPAEWTAPSGNRIAIQYESGQPPKVSIRLQELFGLPHTPRIAEGRIPLLLELLGPNCRPQQLTSDLESFWKNTYPVIRKELARRYPKHHWPEDPLLTRATRSGLKRDVDS